MHFAQNIHQRPATRLVFYAYIADAASRCLKITEKVSFNIASEASYVYIFSGQNFIKNSKIQMRLFGRFSNTVDAASFSAAPTSSFILYLSVDSQKVFVNCSSVKSWVRCNECDLQVGPTLVSPLGGDKCVAFNANRSRQRTYNHQYPQCLKITDTVSFYIASEAS